MRRRLGLTAAALILALTPLAATAAISPDIPYGDEGTATVRYTCTEGTLQGAFPKAGYQGRMHVLEKCGSGYHRLATLGDDGELAHARTTIKVPQACLGEDPRVVPAKDGSAYLLFWGMSAQPGYESLTNIHVCLARVTSTGTLATQFGGSTPFRKLTRTGSQFHTLLSGSIDEKGRLLVFTQRTSGIWQESAAFVNRYTVSGKPDSSFSSDGQRAYTHPYQDELTWGGVVGNKPVIAIQTHYTGDTTGPFGTALVRFDALGDLDKYFSGDGKVYLKYGDLNGASTGAAKIVVDGHKRLVYLVKQGKPGEEALWFDLRRLGPSGVNDARFNYATLKVEAPGGTKIPYPRLELSAGKYVAHWELTPSGGSSYRSTGFNGDGTRWTTLGPNGTTSTLIGQLAIDKSAFYTFEDLILEGPDEMKVSRSLVTTG